jgi:hypothetical protein
MSFIAVTMMRTDVSPVQKVRLTLADVYLYEVAGTQRAYPIPAVGGDPTFAHEYPRIYRVRRAGENRRLVPVHAIYGRFIPCRININKGLFRSPRDIKHLRRSALKTALHDILIDVNQGGEPVRFMASNTAAKRKAHRDRKDSHDEKVHRLQKMAKVADLAISDIQWVHSEVCRALLGRVKNVLRVIPLPLRVYI